MSNKKYEGLSKKSYLILLILLIFTVLLGGSLLLISINIYGQELSNYFYPVFILALILVILSCFLINIIITSKRTYYSLTSTSIRIMKGKDIVEILYKDIKLTRAHYVESKVTLEKVDNTEETLNIDESVRVDFLKELSRNGVLID